MAVQVSKVVSAVDLISAAITAVRSMRDGSGTAAAVSQTVKDLTDLQLEIVADGARIKVKVLKALRDMQLNLPLG